MSSTASLVLLILALLGVVLILASESPAEGPDMIQPPGAEQVEEGLEAVEREEAARRRELEEPDAVHEREVSASAYDAYSVGDSRHLLLTSFPDEMLELNSDPARALKDFRLVDVFGETVATVRAPGGNGSLLEAGIPIRTENEEGELEKVKLALVEGDEGFEAENPLAEVLIPPSADEPFAVGDEGLEIIAQGSAESDAERFGEMSVYYPEVDKDTDLLVAPIAGGLELFD